MEFTGSCGKMNKDLSEEGQVWGWTAGQQDSPSLSPTPSATPPAGAEPLRPFPLAEGRASVGGGCPLRAAEADSKAGAGLPAGPGGAPKPRP